MSDYQKPITATRQALEAGVAKFLATGDARNTADSINPAHYKKHPSGIECIQITRHMGFNLGNAVAYIWRESEKGGTEDLEKAVWHLQDEIKLRKGVK